MEVGFFRMSWASLYIFSCQPFLWRGSSLNSEGLDWTSPWTWYQCIQGKYGSFTLKDVLKKRNPKIWIHPTQTHSSWKLIVVNCCPTWVLFLQMPWNQSPPQFRPRRVPKWFFRWFKAGPFQTFTLQRRVSHRRFPFLRWKRSFEVANRYGRRISKRCSRWCHGWYDGIWYGIS